MGVMPVEIRSMSAIVEGRSLVGIAVPFNQWAEINEPPISYRERFLPDSVEVSPSTTLRIGHAAQGVPLARVGAGTIRFESTAEGLQFRADLPESRGDLIEALERGDLDGSVSIGFVKVRDVKKPAPRSSVAYLRTVQSAYLDHLAIVERPAYAGAKSRLI